MNSFQLSSLEDGRKFQLNWRNEKRHGKGASGSGAPWVVSSGEKKDERMTSWRLVYG